MKLEQLIDDERLKVISDSYQMSIGELAHLYESRELTIDPDFQRELRWDKPQKVRFIESILLQFPLPSIFVASRSNGTWDLLDGLQRISTIFEFMGILRDTEDVPVAPFRLAATERFPALEDVLFSSDHGEPALSTRYQTEFKRHRLDVKIILRQSHPQMLYDLFTRLAIGGTQLTRQDVRNALISKNDSAFRKWLNELVKDQSFQSTLSLSDSDLRQRYDFELALVFLLLANAPDDEIAAISDLDEGLNALIKTDSPLYDYERESNRELFTTLFQALERQVGPNSFEPKHLSHRPIGLIRGAFVAIASALVTAMTHGTMPDAKKILKEYWELDPPPETFSDQVLWGRRLHCP